MSQNLKRRSELWIFHHSEWTFEGVFFSCFVFLADFFQVFYSPITRKYSSLATSRHAIFMKLPTPWGQGHRVWKASEPGHQQVEGPGGISRSFWIDQVFDGISGVSGRKVIKSQWHAEKTSFPIWIFLWSAAIFWRIFRWWSGGAFSPKFRKSSWSFPKSLTTNGKINFRKSCELDRRIGEAFFFLLP